MLPVRLISNKLSSGLDFGFREPLAQSVEQRTFNPWVVGSIPTGLTWIENLAETKRAKGGPKFVKLILSYYRLPL